MNQPILSIDVSKSNSYAATFLSYNQPLQEPFPFTHSQSELKSLLITLNNLENKSGIKPHVVLEATGNLSKPIVSYFESNGYPVVILNPISTHIQKKKSIRKVKTDPIDVNRIAQVYYLENFKSNVPLDSHIIELRNLSRQYIRFTNLYTETQNQLTSLLDLVFPRFGQVFSHISGKTALNVLSLFPTPDSIISASRLDLIEALKPARKPRKWYEIKADELLQAARDSVPDTLGYSSNISNLKNYIELLKHQQSILLDIKQQMHFWAKQSLYFDLLLSIPGVGELTAMTILAEIGDIKKFPTAKQLVAFAGLDPSVYQSGNFKASHNKISKRGSTYLRRALYQATVAGISNRVGGPVNDVLYSFYSKKLAEGKPSKVAIIATSNKLLRIIFGVLKNNQPFKN